jgi:hypothetical protein
MRVLLSILALLVFYAASAFAAESNTSHIATLITRQEFEKVVIETAKKVDAFQAVWKADKDAKLFGGVARDVAVYVIDQFKYATNRQEAERVLTSLRNTKTIPVRRILRATSDLDVVTTASNYTLPKGSKFGVGRVESIDVHRFDLNTAEGQSEQAQGYLPIEKLLLSQTEFTTVAQFGDGVAELYADHPTAKIDLSKFWGTHYAVQKLNHPILLAARFVRLRGLLSHAHGKSATQISDTDSQSLEFVKKAVQLASNRDDFKEFVMKDRFRVWLEKLIFSVYTGKTDRATTDYLMKSTGLEALNLKESITSIQALSFKAPQSRMSDQTFVQRFGFQPSEIIKPASQYVPDGRLYHGTPSEEAFQYIINDGFVPSSRGAVGPGLYTVPASEMKIAVIFAGNVEDRIVELEVDPNARFIDLRDKPNLFLQLARKINPADPLENYPLLKLREHGFALGDKPGTPLQEVYGDALDVVARELGVDGFIYILSSGEEAVLVKNSAAIRSIKGYKRNTISAKTLVSQAKAVKDKVSFFNIVNQLPIYQLRDVDLMEVFDAIQAPKEFVDEIARLRQIIIKEKLSEIAVMPVVYSYVAWQLADKDPRLDQAQKLELLKFASKRLGVLGEHLTPQNFDATVQIMDAMVRDKQDIKQTIAELNKSRTVSARFLAHTPEYIKAVYRIMKAGWIYPVGALAAVAGVGISGFFGYGLHHDFSYLDTFTKAFAMFDVAGGLGVTGFVGKFFLKDETVGSEFDNVRAMKNQDGFIRQTIQLMKEVAIRRKTSETNAPLHVLPVQVPVGGMCEALF